MADPFVLSGEVSSIVIGVFIVVLLVVAYLFGVPSYLAGLGQVLPGQPPLAGGVAVFIVPQKVSPEDQTLTALLLLFRAARITILGLIWGKGCPPEANSDRS